MKKFLLLIMFCLPVMLLMAQPRTVKGKVTTLDGKAIAFATVSVKGTSTAVSADEGGNFSIQAPPNSILVFSATSYKAYELNIGNETSVDAVLSTKDVLGEVVVTAIGITRAQKSLGYATSTLKNDELIKARETNIVNSLAGKVAGVTVTSQSGTVGGSSKIIVRGTNTMNNTSTNGNGQPIWVVDGLPINNSAAQTNVVNPTAANPAPQGAIGVDYGNRASDLNADDIETITVLKGAAATALYGARAKDGAIIITTKKGKKGQTSIILNSSARMDKISQLPDLQNEYAQGNQGVYNLANTNGWGPKISEVQDKTFPDFLGRQVKLQAFPNNVKDFYNTGQTYINSVAFEGGGESGDFRLGYTNSKETGIVPGEELSKNNLSFNGGRSVAKGFDVRASINYARTTSDGRPIQGANDLSGIQGIILGLPRTVDIHDLESHYVDPITGQQITLTPGRTGNNPYWVVNNNKFSNIVDRVFGNMILSYSPVKWLTISDNFGTDYYNDYRKGVNRNGTIGALTGNFFTANLYNQIINNDLILTYTHQINNDLGLKVIAGHNVLQQQSRREQAFAQTLTVDNLYTFANAATVSKGSTKQRLVGVYGDIGLSYKNLLFLNVTGRNDWTSTLPVANNSYFYPSVSSSFLYSDLLPNLKWLNYGKLRGSWARVGSDAAPYQLAFAYLSLPSAFVQYSLNIQFPFNNMIGFIVPNSLPNAVLKPQQQTSVEIGTEMRMFNNRVNLDLNFYRSETAEQIISLNVPRSTGFFNKVVNAGSVINRGVEITLGVIPVKTKDITWETDFTFFANKQKSQLPPQINSYTLQGGFSGLAIKTRTGESFAIWGTAWQRDSVGNIVIDANTGLRKTVADQRLGNVYPDWTLGINNNFSYKNVSLSFLFDIRQGGVMWSNTSSILRTSGLAKETAINRDKVIIDKGVVLDPVTNKFVPNTVPVQSMQDFWGQFTATNTEGNIYNASYVKLREVRISYRFSNNFLGQNIKFIKGLELGLEGRNLWLIKSHVPHVDPEVNLFGSASLGDGVEFNSVPSYRSFGVNLRVKL